MEKGQELYSGKAKSVFLTQDPAQLIMEFRDDTSAFDGEKIDQLARKGMVNNRFNAFIMDHLESQGVATHFEGLRSDTESKLEFGRFGGQLLLGDEFTPDGCRLWDTDTRKKLDKDRFRQGLGGVVEAYEEVALRLGVDFAKPVSS